MIADFEEMREFAEQNFDRAKIGSVGVPFAQLENRGEVHEQYQKSAKSIRASLVGSEPEYAKLDTAYGMAAWAVIASVDMRSSSQRAVRIGAEHTYLTMHTYLPTMAELVCRSKGLIVGLRGDGLFASFGLTKLTGTGREVTPEVANAAITAATQCGKAMLEAVEEIIGPLLQKNDIDGRLQIGVGIDVGNIVVTRIGLRDAAEVTAYGPPVNKACKLCSKTTDILLTPGAESIYPTTKGGKMGFRQTGDGFIPIFPPGTVMLERSPNPIRMQKAK